MSKIFRLLERPIVSPGSRSSRVAWPRPTRVCYRRYLSAIGKVTSDTQSSGPIQRNGAIQKFYTFLPPQHQSFIKEPQ